MHGDSIPDDVYWQMMIERLLYWGLVCFMLLFIDKHLGG